MQQRYYDPIAGRFLSIDPVTTDANTGGSFNRYEYAKNSPYKYLDPDGRAAGSLEGCQVGCTGVTVGYAKGELAVTINVGIGIGGGVSVDPRSDQNGRINDGPGGAGHPIGGITVAGYTKAGAEIQTPLVSGGGGVKLSGGRDLATGKNIGGPSVDAGASKPGAIGVRATQQSGVEVSIYVKPSNALQAAAAAITSKITAVVSELFSAKKDTF